MKKGSYRSLGSASLHRKGGLAADCASPTKKWILVGDVQFQHTVRQSRTSQSAWPHAGAGFAHVNSQAFLRPTQTFPSSQSEPRRKAKAPRHIFHHATIGQGFRTRSPRNGLVITNTTGSSRTCLPTSVTNAQLGAISAEIRFVSQGASKAALSTCVRWVPAG